MSADGSADIHGNSAPDALPPVPDTPGVSETQGGNAAGASNDNAAAQGEAPDDNAKGAAERPSREETVALATPRGALPSPPPRVGPPPPVGSITAEEAFIRGADAAAGRGVPKSDAEALKWYRIAAAMGYAPAQNNLGFMYAEGRGVPRDDAEAVKWYKRAAAQKYPPAETGLGMMYAAGRGVKQSDFEALALYSSAANQGYGQAKANLAAMFGDGRGVARDIMTATFLLGSVRERPYTGSGIYVEPSQEKRANDAQAQSSPAGNTADQGQ
jgi:TPR repeat protein